ncbi:hypothetical protein H5410_035161 [Solanum commersonii]|uniref:Carbohydrate kinase FGGY C-terminal domain-containing protein n=1 Tax=Solanum commersonii TaxID=4109 RepID=A0A9J5Y0F9_SOLCO|nr:hypothetical protein H5410_035161 [Solanum commersonii]
MTTNILPRQLRSVFLGVDVGTGSARAGGVFSLIEYFAVDSEGEPVTVSWSGDTRRNIIVWMDHRAVKQAERINSNSPVLQYCGGGISPRWSHQRMLMSLLDRSGGIVSFSVTAPFAGAFSPLVILLASSGSGSLLWVKENLQESWSMVFRWMDLSDWLTYKATGDDTRSLCTTVCKWTYLGHAHMQQINEKDSCAMESCGWDDGFWEEIGLGDLVDGHHAKIGRSVAFPGHALGSGLTPHAAKELGLMAGTPVGTALIDAHAGGVGVMESVPASDSESIVDEDAISRRMVLVCGTSTCHMAVSRQNYSYLESGDLSGQVHFHLQSMVPEYWLTEGGQSATGSLLDHIIENHVASPHLANRAASRRISIFDLLNEILESMKQDEGSPFIAALTNDMHILPDFHGNRSPIADPKSKGMISGLTLDTSEKQLALLYLATVQGIAYGTRHIVEHCNANGHMVRTHFLILLVFS